MTDSIASRPEASASSKGRFWALLPVVIVVANVAGLVYMASVAVRDPGFALESNYYDKAVHWDRSQAALAESERLGWTSTLVVVPEEAGVRVILTLSRADGTRVRNAAVHAEAFPNARAGELHAVEFAEIEPGVYSGRLVHPRSGLWEFRLAAESGAARFLRTVRADVPRESDVR